MLKRTHEELDAARAAFDALRSATSADQIRGAWTDLLDHLEKVWNKAKLETKATSGPLRKRLDAAAGARNSDELLVYTSQARHADQHSIQISAGSGHGATLQVPPGAEFEVNPRTGEVTALKGTITVTGHLPSPVLLPVTNRDTTYAVPKSHLGQPLRSSDPVEVGGHALAFYDALVRDLDALLPARKP